MLPKHPTPHTLVLCGFFLALACCTAPKPADPSAENTDSLQARADTVTSQAEVVTQEPEPDEPFVPEPDLTWDDSLNKYFTEEQIFTVKKAQVEYESIQTASELAHFYMITLPDVADIVNKQIGVSDPDVYSGDNSPGAHWNWFADYFPCIAFDVLCSECSFEAITTFGSLPALAGKTPEPEDDLFFELAQYVYEDYDGRGRDMAGQGGWYKLEGCHFCSASQVGSGQYKGVLERLEKAAPAQALFGKVMDTYRSSALTLGDEFYSLPKAAVLTEIKQVLKCRLTAEEEKEVKDLLARLSKATPNAQFDCATKDCDFGDAENY